MKNSFLVNIAIWIGIIFAAIFLYHKFVLGH
jgi:hypothetical protein